METLTTQKMMAERFFKTYAPKVEKKEEKKEEKPKPSFGKKVFDYVHDKVLVIPEPPANGGWKGGPKALKFSPMKVKLHKDRTDIYSGVGVVPGKIAQEILNNRSHMVVASNRGKDFDLMMVFTIRMWKYIVKGMAMALFALLIVTSSFNFWPLSVPFFVYSAFFLGQFIVTRQRIFAIRSFPCMAVQLGIPYAGKTAKPRVG